MQQSLDTDPEVIHTRDRQLTTQMVVLRELETIRTVLDGRGDVGGIATPALVESPSALTEGQLQGVMLAATPEIASSPGRGWPGRGRAMP